MEDEVKKSLEQLQTELEKLEPAIKHVESAVKISQEVSKIPELHKDFVSKQEEVETNFKDELVSILSTSADDTMMGLNQTADKLEGYSNQVKKYAEKIDATRTQLEAYIEKLDRIDFPTRLSTIENNVTSISTSFNSVQGSINTLQNELNRMDREQMAKLNNITQENKLLKTLIFVSIGAALVAVVTNFI